GGDAGDSYVACSQRECALLGGHTYGVDVTAPELERVHERVQIDVERHRRRGELIGQAGERERRIGQDVRSPTTRGPSTAGHGREPSRDLVREAFVQDFGRPGRRG